MKLIKETDEAVVPLRRRLDAYYANATDYTAFNQPSNVGYFWQLLLPKIHAIIARRGVCRILEFGAGRSGFSLFLRENSIREKVHLTLHDVMSANADWLRGQADAVQFGPVPEIRGNYDMIISTFVVEHMTDPEASLRALWRVLEPRGGIYFVCPRYDWPFYLPPACDHLSVAARAMLAVKVIAARARTCIRRQPAFLLLNDAALFHLPYRTDRDAIHLASSLDLRIFYRKLQADVSNMRFRWVHRARELLKPGGLKAWLVTRYLLVGLAAEKS
jgi:SAM-dependent methyltransferase